jgi:hypothetical protein
VTKYKIKSKIIVMAVAIHLKGWLRRTHIDT